MKRHATAVWNGGIKDGKGAISTQTGVLSKSPYGFSSRFEDGPGTNPEELIAAAHAGCFSMALSLMLGNEKLVPEHIETRAEVEIVQSDAGFVITSSHLDVVAKVPGADAATFERIANQAKSGCPVSKLMKADITMTARLAN
ncbi:OsmC family protein [Dokdonella sp.]|uniref:OsmC family protein n=1 Tax=Dokdonella sp. TaxID=2291710 RepID=UPI0031C886A2|nr:OsmC family protein [Dokdonella sp.]